MTRLLLSSTYVKILFLNLLGAFASFIVPFLINYKYGSAVLANILYIYSSYVLVYVFASIAIPERIQVLASLGLKNTSISRLFFKLGLILFILSCIFEFLNLKYSSYILFIYLYLIAESFSRIANQLGNQVLGQLILTTFPLCFWCLSFVEVHNTERALLLSSSLTFIVSIIVFFYLGIKGEGDIKLLHLVNKASVKNYLNRTTFTALDNLPIILIGTSNANLTVIYAFVSRIVMPISLLAQSALALYIRDRVNGVENFYLSFYIRFRYIALIVFASGFSLFYILASSNLSELFSIPEVPVYILIIVLLFRVLLLFFNLANSISIAQINNVNVFSIVIILALSLLPNLLLLLDYITHYVYFLILLFILLFSEMFLVKKYGF